MSDHLFEARSERSYLLQLTSLRGIACLVVLVGHVIQVIRYDPVTRGPWGRAAHDLVTYLFNAQAAVLLFFVLSGCVLSLSLQRVGRFDGAVLARFYIKRLFRIYPLLWVSVLVAVMVMLHVRSTMEVEVFVDWLSRNLHAPVSPVHVGLALAGAYTRYNGPMWSLRVELIFSVLFPVVLFLMRNRVARPWALAGFIMLALVPMPSEIGLNFGLAFALGALIPMLPSPAWAASPALPLVATIVLLYDRLALGGHAVPEQIYDVIETLAAFVIVRDLYASGRSYGVLTHRVTIWMGELSYSVYLLHLPILLLLFDLMQGHVGLRPLLSDPDVTQTVLALGTICVTLAVSSVTYHLVELPLHNLGRLLASRLPDRARPQTAGRGGEVALATPVAACAERDG
ncbi:MULTISPECIES: acyltransferase family protein [Gluconacetobacter]|uniref:Acyltransferase n=2 Tax=Gluconacetobacter TaxID=89583 RepID=A0A7W4JH58_9PROT|nr:MULTISPECIES: acyltransferase [Gluconacetobacter]MBB2172381.1 acyltransferase [Gluconacetobacter asukensis]MBB2181143.1 acyltransferase [Gluconacetobacter tumulicola]